MPSVVDECIIEIIKKPWTVKGIKSPETPLDVSVCVTLLNESKFKQQMYP